MMNHMKMTAKILRNFCEGANAHSVKKSIPIFYRTHTTPTTITVLRAGEMILSVSDDGECRFYNGVKIPGLEDIALREGKLCPLKEAALARTPRTPPVIPYRPTFPQTPIDHEIRAKGDYEVVTHGSKKIVVPATAKYGQSNPTKHGTKYDKKASIATPELSRTYGKRKIRIRSDGGQSIKTELLRSAFTPTETVEPAKIIKSNIVISKSKMKKNKMGKLVHRNALAVMEHRPCRISM